MKVIICGGGTVGHLTPGISIAEIILKNEPDSKIIFIGRENGEENEVIKKRGFSFIPLKISYFERRLTIRNIKALSIMTKAFKEAANKILVAVGVDRSAANLELAAKDTALYLRVTNREYYAAIKFELEEPSDFRAVVDANLLISYCPSSLAASASACCCIIRFAMSCISL